MLPTTPHRPVTTQTVKNHQLIGSPSNVDKLTALGFDMVKYGRPKRALIRPSFHGIKFVGGVKAQAGLMGYAGDLIFEPEFIDCEFTVEHVPETPKAPAHTDEAKWGAMPYGWVRPKFKNCRFVKVCKEHGIYPHGLHGGLFEDCTFELIGAQAVQVSERTAHHGGMETWDAKALLIPGTITMRRCLVRNCGKPSGMGRASFALTFFGPQSDDPAKPVLSPISAVDIVIEESRVEHRDSLGGAAVFERRPAWVVRGSEFSYRTTGSKGAKPLLFSQGSRAGLIEDYHADVGKHDILDMPAGKLVLRNASGDAPLRIGKTVGGKVTWKTIGTLSSIGSGTI